MILDNENIFSKDQAVTATAASTNPALANQLFHVSAGQRFVDALRQRRHLVGRPMQLIGHGADGALRARKVGRHRGRGAVQAVAHAGKLRSARRKGLSRLRHRARQALKARLQVILVIVLQLVGVRLRLIELRLDIGAERGFRVVAGSHLVRRRGQSGHHP